MPHTVVLAEELSTDAILAGIRAGRSWIAESASIEVSLKAFAGDRSAEIGEWLNTLAGPAVVRVDVRGVPAGTVSLHTAQGEVKNVSVPADGSASMEWRTDADESAFVRIEVRHARGPMAALTNPIVLT